MKKLFCILTLLFSSQIFAALPSVVRFATEATYPPFEYVAASGEIQGFDIDLVKALCKKMQVQCTFSNQPWDSLIPSLKLGKFDAIIGALAITDARRQQVDFSQPYLPTSAIFVASQNSNYLTTPEGLQNKTIGVQHGTTYETYLQHNYPHSHIKAYSSAQDGLMDLQSGRIDAMLGDTALLLDWLKNHDSDHRFKQLGDQIVNPEQFGEGYGIAINKKNPELLRAFNQALAAIKQDGSYDLLVQQYFPKQP